MGFVVVFELGEQGIAGLLRIAEQHGSVGFEEDWIVDGSITDAQRPLHDDYLVRAPYSKDGHTGNDRVGVFLGGAVHRIVSSDYQDEVSFL